jgi:biopolymer transport protein ExbB/TolQ
MNVELLVSMGLAILVALSFVLIWGLFLKSYLKWSEAAQRANELLRSVLSQTTIRSTGAERLP